MQSAQAIKLIDFFKYQLARLQEQRFFRDKLSLSLLLPTIGLNIITIVVMLVRVRAVDFAVPVRYSSLGGFDTLGPWYSVYRIALFGLAATITNTTLAVFSFSRSRITSFFLGVGAFVVGLFCLIIGAAFAVII